MSGPLTPDLALAYLRALQPGGVELAIGAPGEPLAGRAGVVRARSGLREIAVASAPRALRGLLVHDAERVLELLNRS